MNIYTRDVIDLDQRSQWKFISDVHLIQVEMICARTVFGNADLSLFQIRDSRFQRHSQKEERNPRNHQYPENLAVRAPQEPVPHQGGENYVGDHYQNDPHAGVHVVRQCKTEVKEGEQDDVVTKE